MQDRKRDIFIDREEGKKKRVIERWKIILKGHHAPSEGVNMRL